MPILAKKRSIILKGVAILMVLFYNWCHLLPYSSLLENERLLNVDNARNFYSNILDCNHILSNLFSFWGWLGIVIFIFISGYGLATKYEEHSYGLKDVWYSIKKFWVLIIPALLLTFTLSMFCQVLLHDQDLMSYLSTEGPSLAWTYISNIFFVDDILYTTDLYATTWGPWWYFSFAVQLYLVYILLNRWNNRSSLIISIVLSLLLQTVMILMDEPQALRYVRINFMGWMLPFCLGIWYRRYDWVIPSKYTFLIFMMLFVMSDWHWLIWLFQPAIFIVLILLIVEYIKIPAIVKDVFFELGRLSPYIFCLHPIVRYYTTHFNSYWFALVAYVVLSLVGSFCFRWLLTRFVYRNK